MFNQGALEKELTLNAQRGADKKLYTKILFNLLLQLI